MLPSLVNSLSIVADRFLRLVAEDQEFRKQVRRLAQAVLDATETSQHEVSPVARAETAVATITDLLGAVTDDKFKSSRLESLSTAVELPLPALTLGQKPATAESPSISLPQRWTSNVEDDLASIEARCRLKAKAARWSGTRRRLMTDGAAFSTEIGPRDREIIEEAKTVNCFLWMSRPDAPIPSEPRLWEDVAGYFDAVADVLGVLKQLQYEPGANQVEFEQALDLLAEAQSALRVSILKLEGPSDSDQQQVYNWLRTTARENQVYITHFMRSDDPADPSQWAELLGRIEALDSGLQEERKRLKEQKKLLGKVRHKLSLVSTDQQNASDHWRHIALTVEELVNGGLPPSNRELRELLAPAIDEMPDLAETPVGFQRVLLEIDRFLATCPPPDAAPVPQQGAEVQNVAHLLAGRSLVLIGGHCRPAAYKALKDALRLAELYWVETREHESIEYFEPYVARPDVAVILLATRWSSHSYTDIRIFCNRHGKPLVRLPGGYNPNQVAAQIMAQCSDRLGASR